MRASLCYQGVHIYVKERGRVVAPPLVVLSAACLAVPEQAVAVLVEGTKGIDGNDPAHLLGSPTAP